MNSGPNDLDPRTEMAQPGKPTRILNREVFYKGKTIIEQGEEGTRAYYIETGLVEVVAREGDTEVKISELGPGTLFGEMAIISNRPRTATVRALEDTTVTVISRQEFEKKMKDLDDPAIAALIELLIGRLRETTKEQVRQYKVAARGESFPEE